ncbi:hypothetical protein K437DRAFT_275240 [Tilletiaria anomala UBC 951]|uniref:Uncharacterized protein n=1 Tax=Tilletiaria anomala (strain ATCC 24038 / CBS 436.72 / UBC 951) TaxID=1037660 RepID=A0A066VPJ4_TILAU|nr:uncharacterized protein K437DRAFT_275240 [Tilletiaria anomala UBC 951]KDN42208.1 hypothetical protein K437DRAFT_275240 [Tilletiaria anomala UBC 951]
MATHAPRLSPFPPPSSLTQGHLFRASQLLCDEKTLHITLTELRAVFEGIIPAAFQFEVLLEHIVLCALAVQDFGLRQRDGAHHEEQALLAAEAVALAYLAQVPYVIAGVPEYLQPFRDIVAELASVLSVWNVLGGSQCLDALANGDQQQLSVLASRTAFDLVISSDIPREWRDASRLLLESANRTLTMSEMRRVTSVVNQLPAALLPDADTTVGIARNSSPLAFEVFSRLISLAESSGREAPDLMAYSSALHDLPLSLRTFDLFSRLLRRADVVHPGPLTPENTAFSDLIRQYALAPFISRSINAVSRQGDSGDGDEMSDDERARGVNLICQFVLSLLEASLLFQSDPLAEANSTSGVPSDALLSQQLQAAEQYREALLVMLKQFALAHSRLKEANELYKRIVHEN